jgi:hypothetical protein
MLLEFADSQDMVVANTWFDKEDSKKITFESGGCKTVVDYILVWRSDRTSVLDVKVIGSEPCILQHKFMICKILLTAGTEEEKGFQQQVQAVETQGSQCAGKVPRDCTGEE